MVVCGIAVNTRSREWILSREIQGNKAKHGLYVILVIIL